MKMNLYLVKMDTISLLQILSASRALGSVINKFETLKNVSFHSYSTLYNSGVLSILNYSSEIWELTKGYACYKVHLRAIRYYLSKEVHRANSSL